MVASTRATDPESQGYGTIPSASLNTAEKADANEGPFPIDLKASCLAEVFGTCTFVQLGTAANCVATYTQYAKNSTHWAVATIWGIALMLGIYIAGPLSGGHLNPAVSLSFCLARPADFNFRRILPFWLAQFGGAIVAGMMNLYIFHHAIAHYEKKNAIHRGEAGSIQSAVGFGNYYSLHDTDVKNGVHAFFMEALGTGILVFVIFVLTSTKNPIPGAAVPPMIGVTYGVLVALFSAFTGASFNPARDMGPRLVTAVIGRWGREAMTNYLPYLLAPLVGGPVGAFLADHVLYMDY